MAWIQLTEHHVLSRLSEDERDNHEATGENAPRDRLAGILEQVTLLVRSKVVACDENLAKVGPAGTIPDELLWAAAAIARNSLVASLPLAEGESSPRDKEVSEAHRQLNDAAACKLRIAGPAGTLPEADKGGAGVYGGSPLLDF